MVEKTATQQLRERQLQSLKESKARAVISNEDKQRQEQINQQNQQASRQAQAYRQLDESVKRSIALKPGYMQFSEIKTVEEAFESAGLPRELGRDLYKSGVSGSFEYQREGQYSGIRQQQAVINKALESENLTPTYNDKGQLLTIRDPSTNQLIDYRNIEKYKDLPESTLKKLEQAGIVSVSKIEKQPIIISQDTSKVTYDSNGKKITIKPTVYLNQPKYNNQQTSVKGVIKTIPNIFYSYSKEIGKAAIIAPSLYFVAQKEKITNPFNPFKYYKKRREIAGQLATNPSIQTAAGLFFLGGTGKIAKAATGGILGYQSYQTVKNPSNENIASLTVMAGTPLIFKGISRIKDKFAINKLQNVKLSEASLGFVKNKEGGQQIIIASKKVSGKNIQKTISLFDIVKVKDGYQIQKGKVASKIYINNKEYTAQGTFFGSAYETNARKIKSNFITEDIKLNPIVSNIEVLTNKNVLTKQSGAAISRNKNELQQSIVGELKNGKLYLKENNKYFVDFKNKDIKDIGGILRGKFIPSSLSVIKNYNPIKPKSNNFGIAKPSTNIQNIIPVGEKQINMAVKMDNNELNNIAVLTSSLASKGLVFNTVSNKGSLTLLPKQKEIKLIKNTDLNLGTNVISSEVSLTNQPIKKSIEITKNNQLDKKLSENVNLNIIKSDSASRDIALQKPKEISKLKELVKQKSANKNNVIKSPLYKTKQPTPSKIPLIKSKPNSLISKVKSLLKDESIFSATIKRFGADISLGKFGTQKAAEESLFRKLKGTLSASGKVFKDSKPLMFQELKSFRSSEFRSSKKDITRVVQERNFRLGTRPETKEIQYFKKSTVKKKKRLFDL